jgi:DNA polymerase I
MFGIDIETGGLALDAELRLVQISSGEDTFVIDVRTSDPRPLLQEFTGGELVAHNANFEESRIAHHLGIEFSEPMHDTMIMSQVLYGGTDGHEQMRHRLQDVALRELDLQLDKEEQTSDWTQPALSDEQIEYAKRDAEVTLKLYPVLRERLVKEGLWQVYELENRVRRAVHAMETRGVAIHVDRLEEMIDESTRRAEELKEELAEEWGINPGSSKQLIEHFELEGRKDWPKTNGGKPKTDQEAMKRLIDEEPSVKKRIECMEVEKIRSTYGDSELCTLRKP